jgi:hypothetical protein
MRRIAVTIGIAAGIVGLGLIVASLTAGAWSFVLFFIAVVLAVGASLALRQRAAKSGMIAAAIGFAIVFLPIVVAKAIEGVPDLASDPSCDGFCFSRTVGWIIILFGAGIMGAAVALTSAFLAIIFTSRKPAPNA